MIALIPVAGYATRLYPLTQEKPKALLEVGNKPMIEHVFKKIAELKGIEKVVVVSNHLFFSQFEQWARSFQPKTKIPIVVLDDGTSSNETRRGAIGDAQFAVEQAGIRSSMVWVSGDNLFSFSLVETQAAFEAKKADLIGCFDVKEREEVKKFSEVGLDSNKKVVHFVEKPSNPTSTLVSVGIYFYTAETVRMFKTYLKEGNSPDKPGEFVQWLYKRKPVFGRVFDKPQDHWFDIGSFEMLDNVRKNPLFSAKSRQR